MALLAEHLLKPLPADKQIETGPFLEAVSHLPPFFDCLGSPVFTPIKADISGNITKIKAVYDTNPAKFRTLQNILEVEKEMYGAEWPKVGATLALMWLKRGLGFIQVFLQSICLRDGPQEVPQLDCAEDLPGRAVRSALQVGLPEGPLQGAERDKGEGLEKIRLFLVNYTATIEVIYEMYTKMNAELNYKPHASAKGHWPPATHHPITVKQAAGRLRPQSPPAQLGPAGEHSSHERVDASLYREAGVLGGCR
ncbi:Hypothetical predicted protein [Marmota monax]|uniref:Glycolipid transfer protein n=1 Tax=Marmota monax TaxID=9995 RepID=A0A5E4ACP4_MARMO|nr:Hypothetical predicted protein [Marmota monax]